MISVAIQKKFYILFLFPKYLWQQEDDKSIYGNKW